MHAIKCQLELINMLAFINQNQLAELIIVINVIALLMMIH